MCSALVDFAHQLADAAGAVIRPYCEAIKEGNLVVERKTDASPVTRADREAEAAMRALIEAHYPTHGIYGEEYGITTHEARVAEGEPRSGRGQRSEGGVSPPSNNYTWFLDPIDGTRAFIEGRKEWGTLIALCENGVPILGILDQPVTGERWVGVRGEKTIYCVNPPNDGAHLRFEKADLRHGAGVTDACSTRPCPALAAASISTTSQNYFTPPQAVAFAKLAAQCAEVIENGDCCAYGLLARGERDIVIDAGLKPYDILALVPIIEASGGMITDWSGATITISNFANVLACGDEALHQACLKVLNAKLCDGGTIPDSHHAY